MGRSGNQKSVANRIAGECISVRLRLLNRAVTKIYDDAIRSHGIKVSQMNVLVFVAKRASGVSPGLVAQMLQMEKSTVSRNVERMSREGWLAVGPGGDDRSQCLEATAKGRRLLEKAYPQWQQAQGKARDLLGEDGVHSVCQVADKIWADVGRRES
jgi:DNA-binding MarR family transcriptional regulator